MDNSPKINEEETDVFTEKDFPFIVGIDLGTTNSAVSFVDLRSLGDDAEKSIQNFDIPQLTGPGEFHRLAVLPSFLYIPGEYDVDLTGIVHPWPTPEDQFVGALARDQGAKVPNRLVSSAKSWLCHDKVDRNARILPWGAPQEVKKVSPVHASAAYLTHIKQSWNHAFGNEEELFLENQMVILTVPASFDEVARELTLEAAKMTGLTNVTLIEEPLAAFYSWLVENEHTWQNYVQPEELILICDVGGGTTDFTLIAVSTAEGGSPRFNRISVGDHLILGGDNMDMALARAVESQNSGKRQPLSTDRWKALCHQCRQAKEHILSGNAEKQTITLMGTGSRLIDDTISVELDQKTISQILLEGFFPIIDGERDQPVQRPAISEFGLPYEQEPAVTRHLIRFLQRHRKDVADAVGKGCPMPDLILFNGGSLIPGIIQDRIVQALTAYFSGETDTAARIIENPDMNLAVALGAAYYGLVKIGEGVRVGSGSPRSFYLGIGQEGREGQAPHQAICLVERGLDEGTTIQLSDKKFEVLANRPVRFDLYSSSYRSNDKSGEVYDIDDSFTSLPALQTVIQFGKKGAETKIPVRIEAEYTEMGTLALFCRSLTSDHRWQLQFQLRDAADISGQVQETTVLEAGNVEEAKKTIKEIFVAAETNRLAGLVKQIAGIVDLSKNDWPLTFLRDLADQLLEDRKDRRRSALHEARWTNLLGFCLRPGFGDALDSWRVKKAWKIYQQGPAHTKDAQVLTEWWIMWRRLAGGLNPGQQRQLSQDIGAVLIPKKKGAKSKIPLQRQMELWMLVANLERLYVKDKIQWGRLLLSQLTPKQKRQQYFWTLARIGAREPLYGPVDRVIDATEAQHWIESFLDQKWQPIKPVVNALAQIARKTGDRTRDLDVKVIDRLLAWIPNEPEMADPRRFLTEVVPIAHQEEQALFGESLPAGITVHVTK